MSAHTADAEEITLPPQQLGLRMGVLFGAIMSLVFTPMGLLFGGLIGLPLGPCALITAVIGAVVLGGGGGMFSGVLFGAMMAGFLAATRRPPDDVDFEDGEVVRAWGPANHFVGWEGVGGHLYLTDWRLRFVSHGMNLSNHETTWTLSEVGGTRIGTSLGVLRNRLFITVNGEDEVFVLENPDRWVELLEAPPEDG